ncbi:CBS domain-containing protein [Embleya sp. NBC_00896]|uniref:CBS domain-containing protein n=1 Tax=Embleya sp. NBC_00896 TaxID=2975961 RepID=UPI0038703BA8|nr:CBS domain-containing protein [Embleya sp. NBC_00896]
MLHRKIEDVMTHDVATVGTDAGFPEIAGLLETWRVSALPVVDDERRVLGVVSEADLLHTRIAQARADAISPGPHRRTGREPKGVGHTARELMTSPVVTVDPLAGTLRAARLMDRHHVKRLPVVDGSGRLVGIVSRRDLLRTLLQPDPVIRTEIEEGVLREALWLEPGQVTVEVQDAVVRLSGKVDNRSLIDIVVRLCRAVEGVDSVTHDLTYEFDDSHLKPGPPRFKRRATGR